MKSTEIAIIGLIGIVGASMYYLLQDSSKYANFKEAMQETDKEFHVVGTFNPQKPSEYNPVKDPNLFSFYMKDAEGIEKKVMLQKSRPQDFERAEKVVLIGKIQGQDFIASDILMKCPSKYNDAPKQ